MHKKCGQSRYNWSKLGFIAAVLIMVSWSILAFCDEIDDTVKNGDSEEVDQSRQEQAPPSGSIHKTGQMSYEDVNSFDPNSLQKFLKSCPSCEGAHNAKEALELLGIVKKIRQGKKKPDYVIPFKNIGGADGWAGPGEMGFTGYSFEKAQGGYILRGVFFGPFTGGKTPGGNVVSFDGEGNPRCADTDGSIIGFNTDGIEFTYYGGVKFKTPGNEPAYFAVLKGKGFVHLKGAVTVTVAGKKPVNLK